LSSVNLYFKQSKRKFFRFKENYTQIYTKEGSKPGAEEATEEAEIRRTAAQSQPGK
jgi:hypothetical protein